MRQSQIEPDSTSLVEGKGEEQQQLQVSKLTPKKLFLFVYTTLNSLSQRSQAELVLGLKNIFQTFTYNWLLYEVLNAKEPEYDVALLKQKLKQCADDLEKYERTHANAIYQQRKQLRNRYAITNWAIWGLQQAQNMLGDTRVTVVQSVRDLADYVDSINVLQVTKSEKTAKLLALMGEKGFLEKLTQRVEHCDDELLHNLHEASRQFFQIIDNEVSKRQSSTLPSVMDEVTEIEVELRPLIGKTVAKVLCDMRRRYNSLSKVIMQDKNVTQQKQFLKLLQEEIIIHHRDLSLNLEGSDLLKSFAAIINYCLANEPIDDSILNYKVDSVSLGDFLGTIKQIKHEDTFDSELTKDEIERLTHIVEGTDKLNLTQDTVFEMEEHLSKQNNMQVKHV